MITIRLLWFALLASVRFPTTILMTTCWMLDCVTGCAASLPSYYYDYYTITMNRGAGFYAMFSNDSDDNLLNVGLHDWLWGVLADYWAQWVAVKRPCWLFGRLTGCKACSVLQWNIYKIAYLLIIITWIYYVYAVYMCSVHVEISEKPSLRE